MEKIKTTIDQILPIDKKTFEYAMERQDRLTKPKGALGDLENLANHLAGMMSVNQPSPDPCALILAAASHGIADEGVSAFPSEVTEQMVGNFLSGGAAINVIAKSVGATIFLVDAGVNADLPPREGLFNRKLAYGTHSFLEKNAMSLQQAIKIIELGIDFSFEVIDRGFKSIALGDMGIGNTTCAAAVTAAITGEPVETVTGRGTMVDDARFQSKVGTIQTALECRDIDCADGLSVLSAVGGYEIGFLTGCTLGAASKRTPVILDGFPTTASALIAHCLEPRTKDYLIAGHCSIEPGHQVALNHLDLAPILNLGMRLGEGTGAVLSLSVLRAACECLNHMATFEEAAVAGKIQ